MTLEVRDIFIGVADNPFDPAQVTKLTKPWAGISLAEVVERVIPPGVDVVVALNGEVVDPEVWSNMPVPHAAQVVMVNDPGSGRQSGRAFAMILVAIAAAFTGGAAAAAYGPVAGGVAGAAVSVGGALLVNALIPIQQPDQKEISQSYEWNPQTMQRAGMAIPVHYGEVMVYGNLVEKYTDSNDSHGARNPLDFQYSYLLGFHGFTAGPNAWVGSSPPSLNVLLAIGEGPCDGLVEGESSINGLELDVVTDLDYEEKLGTVGQERHSLWNDLQIEYTRNTEIERMVTYEWEMPQGGYDDIVITLRWPRFGVLWEGRVVEGWCWLVIKIAEVGSSTWHTVAEEVVSAGTLESVYADYPVSEVHYGGTAYTVDPTKRYKVSVWAKQDRRDTYMTSYTLPQLGSVKGVVNASLAYPRTAYLAIQSLPTKDVNGNLAFKGLYHGKLVWVYDDVGESWSFEYTNRLAWVLWDVLTQPVTTGDGSGGDPWVLERYDGYNPTSLRLDEFVSLDAFCEELLDDGDGGTSARVRFNGSFDSRSNIWENTKQICAIARTAIVPVGDEFRLVIDKADVVRYAFTIENTRDGYSETQIPIHERANRVTVDYVSQELGYHRNPTTFQDDLATYSGVSTVNGIGLTSLLECWRYANYVLAKNRFTQCSYTWEAGIHALGVEVGQVVYLQPHFYSDARSGRVVSAQSDRIVGTVDVSASGGTDYLMVTTIDASTHKPRTDVYTVSSVSGTTIIISGAWNASATPDAEDVFWFGPSTITKKVRVTGIKSGPNRTIRFTGVDYSADVHTADNSDPVLALQAAISYTTEGRAAITGVGHRQLEQMRPEPTQLQLADNEPHLYGLTFVGDSVDTVTWPMEDSDTLIYIAWKSETYVIDPETTGTTDKWIYWDPSVATDELQSTNTAANVIGKWILCVNIDGDPYPCKTQPLDGAAVANLGALAIRDSVDLATSDVTNKSLANLDGTANTKLNGIETGATQNTGALADLDTVDTDEIDTSAVTTAKVDDEATVAAAESYTSGDTSDFTTSWVTIQSATLTLDTGWGEAVEIGWNALFWENDAIGYDTAEVRVLRGSTEVHQFNNVTVSPGGTKNAAGYCIDRPFASASTTYHLQAKLETSGGDMNASQRMLAVKQWKGK